MFFFHIFTLMHRKAVQQHSSLYCCISSKTSQLRSPLSTSERKLNQLKTNFLCAPAAKWNPDKQRNPAASSLQPGGKLSVTDINSKPFLQLSHCVFYYIIMKVRSCERSEGTSVVKRNYPTLPAYYSHSLKKTKKKPLTTPLYELHLHHCFLCVSIMVLVSHCG